MNFGRIMPYEITITATSNNGFVVRIGCTTRCYTDREALVSDLSNYLYDPKKYEKAHQELDGCRPEPPRPMDEPIMEQPTTRRT